MTLSTVAINSYIFAGWKDRHWYRDCQEFFSHRFGEDRVRDIAKLFAATSINTSLRSNITLFRKALYEIEHDLPIGNYLPNIKLQLAQIRAGKDLTGRKINSFARAMSGDPDAVVVDIWLQRAFDMERQYFRQTKGDENGKGRFRSAGVPDKEYTAIEAWVRDEAKAMGLEARQLGAILWSGTRTQWRGADETRYTTILANHMNNLFNCI